jgi:ABC-type bacteriocin/lantibiotic exporter with double-glycine peptidase domain
MRGYDISKKRIILTAIYNSFSEFLPYIGIMTVLWYGGSEVIKGSTVLTAG